MIRLLTTDADQVEAAYPKGVSEMLGPSSVSVATGTQHAKLRQTLNAVWLAACHSASSGTSCQPTSLQGFSNAAMATYLPGMLDLFSKQLATWPAQISLLGRCKTMIFDATTSVLLGFDVDVRARCRLPDLYHASGSQRLMHAARAEGAHAQAEHHHRCGMSPLAYAASRGAAHTLRCCRRWLLHNPIPTRARLPQSPGSTQVRSASAS